MNNLFLIPFDGGNLKLKGSSKAPFYLKDLFSNFKEINVDVDNYNLEYTQENIIENISSNSVDDFIVGLGGDHSITYGMIAGLKKIHSKFKIIYFDAHLDCEDDFFPPSHEDVIKSLIEHEIVLPENILIIGARKVWKTETDYCELKKIKYFHDVNNVDFLRNEIKNFIKDDLVYFSLDVDFFDSSVSYATGYPEKNGYLLNDFLSLFSAIDKSKLIGFDLVELIPSLDNKGNVKKLLKKIVDVILTYS